MKNLLLILCLICSPVFAFHPDDLSGGEVKEIDECGALVCAIIEKEDKEYFVTFTPVDGALYIMEVFLVENNKPKRIWSILWRDA